MSLLPICSGTQGRRGCLSVNTLTDGGPKKAAVEKSIANYNACLESLILGRLKADRSQFPPEFDPVAASRIIITVYTGLMAMAKEGQSEEQVKLVIGQVVKLLS